MTDTNENIQFDPEKIAKLQPWKASDYLNTDEEIAAYLEAVLDEPDGDPEKEVLMLCSVLRDVIAALRKRQA
jgi:DNA-binding phage protein